jgi:hypothetical protein
MLDPLKTRSTFRHLACQALLLSGKSTALHRKRDTSGMPDDIAVAAKAIQDLQPAVAEFARATGVTAPIQELTGWLADIVRYRRASHQARILLRAASKIRDSGLPTTAVSDRLLRAVLEDGAFEEDESMVERWVNLLASAATRSGAVPAALPEVLRQLEPIEARVLDALVAVDQRAGGQNVGISVDELDQMGLAPARADNLVRLALAYFVYGYDAWGVSYPLRHKRVVARPTRRGPTWDVWPGGADAAMVVTEFGRELVQACRPPRTDLE